MAKYGYTGARPTQGQLENSGVFEVNDIQELLKKDQWSLQVTPITVEYLVVAGGGGGGEYSGRAGGGGGAGGYRNSYASETSGANSSTETPLNLYTVLEYNVTVGAGGSGAVNNHGTAGEDSVFHTITSVGGGQGVRSGTGGTGGSGGGNSYNQNTVYSTPTANQGFKGGLGNYNGHSDAAGGGGGGASQVGTNGVHLSNYGRPGGNGLYSSITGSSVGRAGGGTGGGYLGLSGDSGSEGGGAYNGDPGTVNTGGGGGGNGGGAPGGGNGGSGVVILRWATAEASSVTTTDLTTGGVQTDGTDSYIVITGGDGTIRFNI